MNISGTAGQNQPIPNSKESGEKYAPDEIGTVENYPEMKENCIIQQGAAVPEKKFFLMWAVGFWAMGFRV